MQRLSITRRPAQTKGSIASRPELHGDDVIGALTISIGGILLFAKDLVAMYNDEDAHSRLFKKVDGGLMPAFPGTTLVLTEIFKGAKVTIMTDDMAEALVLKPATVKDICLEPQDAGGHVLMSCKVLGAPPDDATVNPLHMLSKKCRIAILNGALANKDLNENQAELPLEEGGPAADDDDDDTSTAVDREEAQATEEALGESSMGRKIRASETKAKKKKRAKR